MIPPIPSRKEAVSHYEPVRDAASPGRDYWEKQLPSRGFPIAPGKPARLRNISDTAGPSPGRGRAESMVPRGFAGSLGSMGSTDCPLPDGGYWSLGKKGRAPTPAEARRPKREGADCGMRKPGASSTRNGLTAGRDRHLSPRSLASE